MKIRMQSLSGEFPRYQTEGAAGMDIKAYISEQIVLKPFDRVLVSTGLFMEIEPGFEVQIRARSGLAIRNGICLVNGIGTIDSDYRGEVKVALINLGNEDFLVKNGDRIAQIVVNRIEKAEIEEADILTETRRGDGGFGHTGV